VTYVAPLHKPCLVICNTRAACRFCSSDRGFGALSKLQFQCLNVDWNDTLFLSDLWIIAWIDEINLSSVYCKSSSSSSGAHFALVPGKIDFEIFLSRIGVFIMC
jgi:hypothetical protein